jgi:hypothetical protein
MMPVEMPTKEMWTLSEDRKSVRLAVPSLPIAGLPQPLRVNIDFAADMVDAIIDRLTELRAQMLPTPTAATIECVYEFTPPIGKAAILVLGIGLSCDDELWRLKIPAEY